MNSALDDFDVSIAATSANPHTRAAAAGMIEARDELSTTVNQLSEARKAVPALFEEAKTNYLAEIDESADTIRHAFQKQLNGGFSGMFTFMAWCALIGFVLTMMFHDSTRGKLHTKRDQQSTK